MLSETRRSIVTHCDGQLRRDIYRGLVFRTKEEAESAETSLAVHLESLGYAVWGGARPRNPPGKLARVD